MTHRNPTLAPKPKNQEPASEQGWGTRHSREGEKKNKHKAWATRPNGSGVQYYHDDQLGTTRIMTDASGTKISDCTYAPFGEEVSCSPNYAANHYKFTGKERDSESGLDYFGARYYGSNMGRFMSPDPLGGHNQDPQTLNRYVYVRNNPLVLTDPTGLDFYLQCASKNHSGCTQVQTDPDNKKSTQWVQADSNGKATIVTSDSIRDGQNTAALTPSGLQINGSNQGIYFDNPASHSTDANGHDVNHNSLDIAGSTDLKGFNFHVDGNCGGTCLSAGEWSSHFSYAQARDALSAHSFTIPFENAVAAAGGGEHPHPTQYRFGRSMIGCAVSSCPNTPHISVPSAPKSTVPSTGGWHVDAHSGWWAHGHDIQETH